MQSNFIQEVEAVLHLIKKKLPNSNCQQALKDLVVDVAQDQQLITVLGEFKRGKSTLINAFIQEPLLPSDVTPTTATINIISHSEETDIQVVKHTGEVEEHRFSRDILQNYTFEGAEELEKVHHINIRLNLQQLHEKLVIVDTPGVGDLNEHRLDVTYSYIPRSNLVLFVFDATTPIRRTEIEYLEEVLKLKFGEIIFIANFIDRLDDDELEETMEYMEARLKKIMKDEPFQIFPISSKMALENPQDPDFQRLLSYMIQQLEEGEATKKKMALYENRFQHLYEFVKEEIEQIEQVRKASDEELTIAYRKIDELKQRQERDKETLRQYMKDRQEEVISLTWKSVDHFRNGLVEDVHEVIDMYDGPKFQNLIEKQIPSMIKNRLKNWVITYTPQIEKLIYKLEKEVVEGFHTMFHQEIGALRASHASNYLEGKAYHVQTRSGSSNMSVTAGMITAGAGTILIFLSGGLLLPIITMAGFPFLNKFLSEKKLEALKADVIPHIDEEIDKIIDNLKSSTKQYIEDEVHHIHEKAIIRYEEMVKSSQLTLEEEMYVRKQTSVSALPSIELQDLLLMKK
ncbi:hypothetical protein DS745_07480 [Anaerobacillus alkaliphilus]|uniref:Dynamin N-terminal domain-containing protein n=1 Tax=Anaerobacillus alkaliphilus TaxID=1548597 RepID=A0A4Q0VVW8_9BACI|nr:dynamin family protein [Anaerobacillus alkaliphilus]RXJ02222.1 hypothetical protein DS745_07480 [Anaerobacillus alkaliphilus]